MHYVFDSFLYDIVSRFFAVGCEYELWLWVRNLLSKSEVLLYESFEFLSDGNESFFSSFSEHFDLVVIEVDILFEQFDEFCSSYAGLVE